MITMESLSMVLSSSPPLQNHPKTHKSTYFRPIFPLPNSISMSISTSQSSISRQTHFPSAKTTHHLPQLHPSIPLPAYFSLLRNSPFVHNLTKTHLSFAIIELFTSLPCFASETVVSSTEQASDKINLEAIVVSVDDFFNRNPFFVAGCTFIWLVVIPLTQEYLSKYKFISAIDAFRKLRDDPNAQLLDIREKKTLVSLGSPNLKILNKGVIQVQFTEEDEDGFVKEVLGNFAKPENTIICILDNFDGNSMKAAELLFKNGFKEAYAIRGGVRGKKGWLAIQETLLPPSVHIYPKKKKVKISKQLGTNGAVGQQIEDSNDGSSSNSIPLGEGQRMDHAHLNKSTKAMQHKKISSRSSSPYPNYPDMKPPSSPTPSKP